MNGFFVPIFALFVIQLNFASADPFAQGNLALVFDAKSGRSSENSAQIANLSALWCQATSDGSDQLPIKSARFIQLHPPPLRHHQARLSPEGNRAFLDFGLVPISVIGKYRCEITTEDDKLVTGNLFVYMRPVLVANASMRLVQTDEANAFAWVGPTNKATAGETATVHCPVAGYPKPTLSWSKDGTPINLSAIVEDGERPQLKYLLDGQNLRIRRVCGKDEGIYKCVAHNEFSSKVDLPKERYELSLEQNLRVGSSLSWLPPLLVIVVCLLLLIIIIFGCSAWKKYKQKQYNVAEKEKKMGKRDAEKQRLPTGDDDEAEE
ncbi:hypothetical protein niasHT_027987 [Heterodera trifolii]|uniref:Ig-like domain-containing protein n=1 Tax=Heterodera trifolii TaxID=157864 RepID=A0ABD2KEF5_9BILA